MPTSWTKDEEKQLVKEIKEKKSYDELSKIHNRSVSALIMRFNKIIYDNIEAGKNKQKLAKLFDMSIDKINQSYYEHKAFLEKKQIINKEELSAKSEKSTKSIKSKEITDDSKYSKIMKKMEILQKENKLMKEIIENVQLKQKMGKTLNNKELYAEIMKLIKNKK